MKSRKEIILLTLTDQVSDFLYCDRKEDEELPIDSIEEAVKAGELSVEDLVSHFESELRKGLGR